MQAKTRDIDFFLKEATARRVCSLAIWLAQRGSPRVMCYGPIPESQLEREVMERQGCCLCDSSPRSKVAEEDPEKQWLSTGDRLFSVLYTR